MYVPCLVNACLKFNVHSRALTKHITKYVCSMYDNARLKS